MTTCRSCSSSQEYCRSEAGLSPGADFPFPCPGEVLRGAEPFLSASVRAAAASLLVS